MLGFEAVDYECFGYGFYPCFGWLMLPYFNVEFEPDF